MGFPRRVSPKRNLKWVSIPVVRVEPNDTACLLCPSGKRHKGMIDSLLIVAWRFDFNKSTQCPMSGDARRPPLRYFIRLSRFEDFHLAFIWRELLPFISGFLSIRLRFVVMLSAL